MSTWPAIIAIANGVNAGRLKAVDQVQQALKVIDEKAEYKAIIATAQNRALRRAEEIDKRIANGEEVGKLAGVPFIAKDNFLTLGVDTTAASNILKGFNAPYQATAIEKLEAEGAICVAKANLDAFAHGSSTENSDFFTTLNPHDKTRVPGGSSGGSAAAVVLQMVPFALGTDTGGSVRLPAAYVGCIGYKPTYGLISRSGIVAMGSSTDVVGVLANTVDDTALVLDALSGRDPLDSTTIDCQDEGYDNIKADIKGKKVGVISEYMSEGVDDGVKQSIVKAVQVLEQAGAEIEHVSLPSLPLALAVYYIICPAEVSSNLSRYDGQKFGYSDEKAETLDESYTKSRSSGFGSEAKRRIMIGTYVLSSGYYDAYYKKAQVVRTKIINEFKEVFEKVDFLLGPTASSTAFKLGENTKDPLRMYLSDIMTVASNLAGIPAVSVPAGTVDGLPVGLHLMAPQRKDRELLELAKAAEKVLV